ncbi:MAG: hypothetical protein F6K26_13955 [Moorea sp. SIO2I5]|nr:hypothetical protein [Moorena sp. SIO2I5]
MFPTAIYAKAVKFGIPKKADVKADSIAPILDVQINKGKSHLDLFSTNQKQLLPTHILFSTPSQICKMP